MDILGANFYGAAVSPVQDVRKKVQSFFSCKLVKRCSSIIDLFEMKHTSVATIRSDNITVTDIGDKMIQTLPF